MTRAGDADREGKAGAPVAGGRRTNRPRMRAGSTFGSARTMRAAGAQPAAWIASSYTPATRRAITALSK